VAHDEPGATSTGLPSNFVIFKRSRMPGLLLISGIVYGVYSLSATAFAVGTKHLKALHEDLRAEIRRGGAMGSVCRFIQPLIWLLTLPLESLLSALALAGCLVCAGMLL
jgi:hypothetical protein